MVAVLVTDESGPPREQWVLDHFDSDAVCEFYGSTERQFIACSAPNGRSLGHRRMHPGGTLPTDTDNSIWRTVHYLVRVLRLLPGTEAPSW